MLPSLQAAALDAESARARARAGKAYLCMGQFGEVGNVHPLLFLLSHMTAGSRAVRR